MSITSFTYANNSSSSAGACTVAFDNCCRLNASFHLQLSFFNFDFIFAMKENTNLSLHQRFQTSFLISFVTQKAKHRSFFLFHNFFPHNFDFVGGGVRSVDFGTFSSCEFSVAKEDKDHHVEGQSRFVIAVYPLHVVFVVSEDKSYSAS